MKGTKTVRPCCRQLFPFTQSTCTLQDTGVGICCGSSALPLLFTTNYLFAPFLVHFETLKTLSHLGMLPSTSSGVAPPESGCCFHRAPKNRRAWRSGHHPAWRNKSPFLAHKRSVFLAPQCPAPSVCSQHSWPRFVEGTAEAW